ncbi:fimbrial protein [Ventosimonas gracilis]|uniref:Fimbrial protein n=1 Tax=Ventosimonas gracilis TaxID=1680762 RepID=A0A139SU90_9GAMM|nr:fimbrial protein [Ventosimonas gracilis]KXU38143.1 fimbrial protein [Ventosimonas gracilis]
MKHIFSPLSLAAAIALACAGSAQAADGTITINGQITDVTCNIDVNGGGSNGTVTLPTVSTSTLDAAGKTAGATPFNITLSGCASASGGTLNTASTWFEPGANVDSTTGRLISTGTAGNVQVELLNSAMNPIAAGAAVQNDTPANISSGTGTLSYYSQYYATGGAATAGTVATSVQYTITYQ